MKTAMASFKKGDNAVLRAATEQVDTFHCPKNEHFINIKLGGNKMFFGTNVVLNPVD